MTESQNLGAEGQISGRIQPIDGGSEMDGGAVELGSCEREESKRKRGRPPRAQAKALSAKRPAAKKMKEKEDEDVCFICFDGGSLVLCDHRDCPKAYHPACIKRDAEFFESAAQWTCGWHICSICQKTAHHMCYTCTYSLCRTCIRKADYVGVRGDKGFCTVCMKTIMLIENNGQGEDGKVLADFDDKLSWEYLFKVYWIYIKRKLSLTVDELTQAKTTRKEASTVSSSLPSLPSTVTVSSSLPSLPSSVTISSSLPSTAVHDRTDDLRSTISATSAGNPEEENESKRRKKNEEINIPKETVITEKPEKPKIDERVTTVVCDEWASKELLDFVAHMKNGSTAVLSLLDVQALMTEYINTNNLSDPKKKNQIICDSRLVSLFGKPRVRHSQMQKLLEHHFVVKEGSRKRQVNRSDVGVDPESNNDRKRRSRSKGEEHVVENNLEEYAAVDVHNISLIYLWRDLMENLLEDSDGFHGKVVGSIVRIRISGCDLKQDMYRLVQVVGTSKVDVPYKIDKKSTDIMLEVLNLDKKETVSIDAISDQEFSEEECRRLQRSVRCGIVRHFTVGEIQEKAVVLQPVKLNDWLEKEILRLNHLCDVASEKGHKKSYGECMEKIQLLKTPEEQERRLKEIPDVHLDPKTNPDYESDDTEEYFNKEHGDHMESKCSNKSSRAPKRRESRSRKDEKGSKQTVTTPPLALEQSTSHVEKDAPAPTSSVEKSPDEVDHNSSTITKLDHQTTLSSSVSNSTPETTVNDPLWHYLDPNRKVQGPFSLVELQRWRMSGYFSAEMRIWANHKDKPVLLADVLEQQFHKHENTTAADKVGNQTDPSSTVTVTPSVPDPVNHEKLSGSQSFGQNWSANNSNIINNLNYNPPSVESTVQVQLGTSNTPRDMEKNKSDVKNTPRVLTELPVVTEKKIMDDHEKIRSGPRPDSGPNPKLVQDSGTNTNQPSWSSASSLVVSGNTKLPVSANGVGKREEWDSRIALEVAADHVATPTSNIDQNVNPSQPSNDFTWHGMGEMIEFSTLAEESVSDLLAEVDAMESQYGLPSPTSRRNSLVDDLFNGSFDEFSPTADQGTRSDGFSSSGDIQLAGQSTGTPEEHLISSSNNNINNGLQQHSFFGPEINGHGQTIGISQRTNSGSLGFQWPDMETGSQGMIIDINRSAKAEGDEGEMETKAKTSENRNYSSHQRADQSKEMKAPKPIGIGAKLVTRVAQIKGLEGAANRRASSFQSEASEFTRPQPLSPPPQQPPPPLTLGLDPYDPCDLGSEPMEVKFSSTGRAGQETNSGQRRYGGERCNSNSSNYSPRDRSHHQVEESGYSRNGRSLFNRQSSFGSGSDSGGGNGRPSSKGQRVCRLYESGRCKKGASCNHLHPSP